VVSGGIAAGAVFGVFGADGNQATHVAAAPTSVVPTTTQAPVTVEETQYVDVPAPPAPVQQVQAGSAPVNARLAVAPARPVAPATAPAAKPPATEKPVTTSAGSAAGTGCESSDGQHTDGMSDGGTSGGSQSGGTSGSGMSGGGMSGGGNQSGQKPGSGMQAVGSKQQSQGTQAGKGESEQ